jgi:periplasmic protein TonB
MKRGPRLLLVAFALSLLIHLLVAVIMHPPVPTFENQPEVVSIIHRPATIAVRNVPTPPPPPRPRPRAVSRSRSSAPPAHKGPGPAGLPGAGTPAPTPVAVATPQPTAAATPNAGCAQANAEAAIVATPAPPDIAAEARTSGTSGVAVVNVQLDTNGQVTGASITRSTGNSSLDLVAVAMARDARYSPALHDCKPIASAYAFSVRFVAW